jgi:hypothetical protein
MFHRQSGCSHNRIANAVSDKCAGVILEAVEVAIEFLHLDLSYGYPFMKSTSLHSSRTFAPLRLCGLSYNASMYALKQFIKSLILPKESAAEDIASVMNEYFGLINYRLRLLYDR